MLKTIFKNGTWPKRLPPPGYFPPGYLPPGNFPTADTDIKLDDPSIQFQETLFDTRLEPALWDEVIHPGLVIRAVLPQPTVYPEGNPTGKPLAETSPSPENVVDEEKALVTYAVDVWQQSNRFATSTSASHVGAQVRAKRLLFYRKEKLNTQSAIGVVLHEVTKVVRGPQKEGQRLHVEAGIEFDDEDTIHPPVLHIESIALLNTLRAVIKFQNSFRTIQPPGMGPYTMTEVDTVADATALKKGRFEFPYADLYHNIGPLIAYKKEDHPSRLPHGEEYNQMCDEHIDILVEFLRDHPQIGFPDMEKMWNQSIPMTTFNCLWMLFKPGEDIFVRHGSEYNMYVIQSVSLPRFEGEVLFQSSMFTIRAWNLDYDGQKFGRSLETFDIPSFDGEREIGRLRCYPTRFHPTTDGGESALRARLVKRGKKFARLVRSYTYQEYTGPSLTQGVRKVSGPSQPIANATDMTS
jgi:hypothetical protein